MRQLGDEILKKIALELTEKLRKSVTVDWSVRESVRARLRIMVKTILKKYKYPPTSRMQRRRRCRSKLKCFRQPGLLLSLPGIRADIKRPQSCFMRCPIVSLRFLEVGAEILRSVFGEVK